MEDKALPDEPALRAATDDELAAEFQALSPEQQAELSKLPTAQDYAQSVLHDCALPGPKFIAVRHSKTVMRAAQFIATACSHTMALRIANALNRYKPNERGF